MSPRGSRAEQRTRTRKALAEAALTAFLDRGLDEVTVEEIARDAGVSTRTFFLHFPSKAAAVFPDHEDNLAWFVQRLSGLPRDDAVGALCDLVVEGVSRQAESPFRQRRRALVHSSPAVRDVDARTDRDYEDAATAHLLERWSGLPGAELSARVTANVVIGVARAALDAWGRDGTDPVTATRASLDRLLRPPLAPPAHSGPPDAAQPAGSSADARSPDAARSARRRSEAR